MQSEYVFRGVSLGRLGVEAYGEARFVDGLLYAGLSAHAAGLDDTVAGVNVAAGFRPRVGPLSFDLGVVRYHRPGGGERAFLLVRSRLPGAPTFSSSAPAPPTSSTRR